MKGEDADQDPPASQEGVSQGAIRSGAGARGSSTLSRGSSPLSSNARTQRREQQVEVLGGVEEASSQEQRVGTNQGQLAHAGDSARTWAHIEQSQS